MFIITIIIIIIISSKMLAICKRVNLLNPRTVAAPNRIFLEAKPFHIPK